MSPIGPALGAFDASLVRDLGLPTIGTEPGLVGPGGADPSGTVASGDASGPGSTQKFQLGETLPVVPARIEATLSTWLNSQKSIWSWS